YNEFQFARRISQRYKTDHHEVLIDREQMQQFLPLLVQLQDEPIADNVCIPLYFLAKLVKDCGTTVVQVGEGADENFLGYWWCEHYRRKFIDVYEPARRTPSSGSGWSGLVDWFKPRQALTGDEDAEIRARARRGEELFWGGAVCWWGEMRRRLTPDSTSFETSVSCPVEGLLPEEFAT